MAKRPKRPGWRPSQRAKEIDGVQSPHQHQEAVGFSAFSLADQGQTFQSLRQHQKAASSKKATILFFFVRVPNGPSYNQKLAFSVVKANWDNGWGGRAAPAVIGQFSTSSLRIGTKMGLSLRKRKKGQNDDSSFTVGRNLRNFLLF